MRTGILFLFLVIFLFACNENVTWQKRDIDKKLHTVFPNAKSIQVSDAAENMQPETDSFLLPPALFKAIVKEENKDAADFIFYFYNNSFSDTSLFSKVFKAVMLHDIKAGLGTGHSSYVLGMPRFNRDGNGILIEAVSLKLDSAYVIDRENKIEKVFELQRMRIKDAKMREADAGE